MHITQLKASLQVVDGGLTCAVIGVQADEVERARVCAQDVLLERLVLADHDHTLDRWQLSPLLVRFLEVGSDPGHLKSGIGREAANKANLVADLGQHVQGMHQVEHRAADGGEAASVMKEKTGSQVELT